MKNVYYTQEEIDNMLNISKSTLIKSKERRELTKAHALKYNRKYGNVKLRLEVYERRVGRDRKVYQYV